MTTGYIDETDVIRKTRKNGKRLEKYYAVYHACGHKTYLRKHDAKNGIFKQCAQCQRSDAGRKGYRATLKKLGKKGLDIKVAAARRNRPSKPEIAVNVWLQEAGLVEEFHYRREEIIALTADSTYFLDFSIGNGKGIEVFGFWHKRTKQEKDARLAQVMNILFVDADLIASDPERAKAAILEFIK